MNKQFSAKTIAFSAITLTLIFLATFYIFAWTEPSQSPPQGNTPAPLNTGAAYQIKAGPLVINAGRAPMGLGVIEGNVGIGINPSKKLDVFGDVRALSFINAGGENLPATCDNNNRGQQYLLKGGSGEEDTLYICKVKQNAYVWQALDSPQIMDIWKKSSVQILGPCYWLNDPVWQNHGTFEVPADAKKIICNLKVTINERNQTFSNGGWARITYKGGEKLSGYASVVMGNSAMLGSSWEAQGGGTLNLDAYIYGEFGNCSNSTQINSICYYIK